MFAFRFVHLIVVRFHVCFSRIFIVDFGIILVYSKCILILLILVRVHILLLCVFNIIDLRACW